MAQATQSPAERGTGRVQSRSAPLLLPALAPGALADLAWGRGHQHGVLPGAGTPRDVGDSNSCISSRIIPEEICLIVRHGHVCNFSSPPLY